MASGAPVTSHSRRLGLEQAWKVGSAPSPQPSVQEQSLWLGTSPGGSGDLTDKSAGIAFAFPRALPGTDVSGIEELRVVTPGCILNPVSFSPLSLLLFVDIEQLLFFVVNCPTLCLEFVFPNRVYLGKLIFQTDHPKGW